MQSEENAGDGWIFFTVPDHASICILDGNQPRFTLLWLHLVCSCIAIKIQIAVSLNVRRHIWEGEISVTVNSQQPGSL